MRAIRAGAVYFILVFAVGWLLGPIRQLWVEPRFGATVAVLLEAPPMLAAMIAAARWVVRRFVVPRALRARVAMGLVALALLLLAEVAGALWLRGLATEQYFAQFGTVPGLVALLLFLLFAAMPALVARSR